MRGTAEIFASSQQFILDPERAIFWKSQSALLISDLHLGKAETFQKFGVPLSSDANAHDLMRLSALAKKYQAQQIWILGDLLHGRLGFTNEVELTLKNWLLAENQIQVNLIQGNHDKNDLMNRLQELPIKLHRGNVDVEGVVLSHEGQAEGAKADLFCIYGHVHPVVRLRAGNDNLRLACFARGENFLILPAFSQLAGGWEVDRRTLKVYPIMDETVAELD